MLPNRKYTGLIKILGSYGLDNQQSKISFNRSKNLSSAQVKKVCEEMVKYRVDDLTLNFDDEQFAFFHNINGSIRFLEGHQNQYADLQHLVKQELEGSVLMSEEETGLEDSVVPVRTIRDGAKSEVGLIHDTLLQDIKDFQGSFTKAELYFKPFEAPGGDFYWITNYDDTTLTVVGDCTGHGMQGAMIAMSAMTLLKEFYSTKPDNLQESLYEFHERFRNLIETAHQGQFDVELGLLLINKNTHQAAYMGSGINLIQKREDKLKTYGSRKSKFVLCKQQMHIFNVKSEDQYFMFSDGIPDQFDDRNEKRLKRKGLNKILSSSSSLISLDAFMAGFNTFKGSTAALDDQTMLILTI